MEYRTYSHLPQPKFDLWAEHLFKGITVGVPSNNEEPRTEGHRVVVSSANGSKAKDAITIQVDGGKFSEHYVVKSHSHF